jgi:hypothetical protein
MQVNTAQTSEIVGESRWLAGLIYSFARRPVFYGLAREFNFKEITGMRQSLQVAALVTAFLAGGAPACRGQGGGSIWDASIMRQPFDKTPFRQIKVPDWVAGTIGCGYTLSVMDSQSRAAAAAHGVTLSEMGFVDPFYAYYDSRLLKRRSPHVPADRLAKDNFGIPAPGRADSGSLSPLPAGRSL